MSKSNFIRFLILSLFATGLVLVGGDSNEAHAQSRDPFRKNPKMVRRNPSNNGGKRAKPKPKGPVIVNAPPIEQRISYFMSLREQAAMNGRDLPKVTSVLTLNEMSVIGIFRTPRGYAAMVEATPIKLSYTIYPGEKFFDGQLVAVEENRLIFRKITKMSNNKFISTVENKTLRQFDVAQEIQGTVGAAAAGAVQTADSSQPAESSSPVVSPLEEMNQQKAEEAENNSAQRKVARKP